MHIVSKHLVVFEPSGWPNAIIINTRIKPSRWKEECRSKGKNFMVKPLEQEDNKGEVVTDPDHSKAMNDE